MDSLIKKDNQSKGFKFQITEKTIFALILTALAGASLGYYYLYRPACFLPMQPNMGNDPCDLRFIGMRKNYADELFASNGKFLHKDPCVNIYRTHWDRDVLQREFIFDIPVSDDSFKIASKINIYLNGHRGYSVRSKAIKIKYPNYTRLVIDAALPRLSLLSDSKFIRMRGGEPVKFVDIEVLYFAGKKTDPNIVFAGPFIADKTKDDIKKSGYQITAQTQYLSDKNLMLHITVTAKHI